MKLKMPVALAAVAIVAAGAVLFCGCEDDPDVSDINSIDSYFGANQPDVDELADPGNPVFGQGVAIVPQTYNVTFAGQQVTFAVKGGTPPYSWQAANIAFGDIVGVSANTATAIYGANKVAPNSVTVTDDEGLTASAEITADTTFLIIPGMVTLTAAQTNAPFTFTITAVNFGSSGGIEPLGNWNVSIPALGTINPNSGVYTVTSPSGAVGSNTVWRVDAAGQIAYAAVVTYPKQ